MSEEELYKQKELKIISLVEKYEQELEKLKIRYNEISNFIDKIGEMANAKKKSIRKKVLFTTSFNNILDFRMRVISEISHIDNIQIKEFYESILTSQTEKDLDLLEAKINSNILKVKNLEKALMEKYLIFKRELTPAEMVSLEENPRNLPINKNLSRVKYSTSENFVTETGLKMRKTFLKVLQNMLKSASRRETVVESFPKLDKDESYIFVPDHLFDEETNSLTIALDRPAFILIGSTDQIEHNPVLNGLWLSGMIYVNRGDKESRKDSIKKMERLLNSGTSVIAYVEGRYNNTENKLVEKMFYSPYELWQATGKKVVPVSTYTTSELDKVYVRAGEPIEFNGMNKHEAIEMLRDKIATMHYEQIEEHSIPLTREYLSSRKDPRLDYMIQRREEYCHHPWYNDVWDEELTGFIDKSEVSPEEVRASFDNVIITPQNASIMAPILLKREEDKKYDFKQFMKNTYNKNIRELYPDNNILDFEYQKPKKKQRTRKK